MLNIRLTTIASGPVNTVPVTPDLPPAAPIATPLPVVEDLGTCEDCGADLEIHCSSCNASYCESCEYGF